MRQDILRVGKQPGQGLEARRRAWEGGDTKTGLSGAEWACWAARGLERQTETLTLGLLGREWLGRECSQLSFQELMAAGLQRLEVREGAGRSGGS